ncbi:MAG: efflux RND transporter permease subunit [Chromatiales bacterium]|nr:efflux RND transporter permease subunit [Chromatiales bacterium]
MLKFAIERGTIVTVTLLILCLFGALATIKVPVQMIPDMESPIISVETSWPGASPQEVETEIIIEQERYLRRLQGLKKMTSVASTGSASINLEFTLQTDSRDALLRVNNALSQISRYPENVDPPTLNTTSTSQSPFIFYRIDSLAENTPLPSRAELSLLLEKTISSRLTAIAGVAEVLSYLQNEYQIHIHIDPAKLAARQITLDQVRNAIRQNNRNTSGGDIETGKHRYQIRTLGRYQNIETLENTIIADRNGHFTYLKDIADVSLSHQELRSHGYLNGKPAFVFSVTRNPGSNVLDIYDQLNTAVAELNTGLLQDKGLVIRKNADDVKYVRDAISVVQKNLLLGGLLACVILYLFLHSVSPTLLGTLGVPVSTVGALLGLLLAERSLNVISLSGVAFAIGMTLDNSIVVIENIFRHRAQGKSHKQAALDGVREVWPAVLASTLTTVFVFTPILLIEEEAGQLYSDIAIAISAAILMSMLVAVTAIPSAMARLPDRDNPERKRGLFFKPFITFGNWTRRQVAAYLNWVLTYKRRSTSVLIVVLAGSTLIMLQLTPQAEYLPEGEESKIFAMMFPPPGYSLSEMDRVAERLRQGMSSRADSSTENGSAPNLELQLFQNVVRASSIFNIAVPVDQSPQAVEQLIQNLSQQMRNEPGMIAFANRGSIFSDNSGGSRSIQLHISGADLEQVYQTALHTFRLLRENFPTAQVRAEPGLSLNQPSLEIYPNWERAREMGLGADSLGYLINAFSDGAYVDDYFLDDNKIDIYLYGRDNTIDSPNAIAQLPVYTPSGATVPVAALGRIEETLSADTIQRINSERTVTLTMIPPRSIALETAAEQVEQQLIPQLKQEGKTPAGVLIRSDGATDKLKATRQALSDNLLVAVALSYLLMVAIFNHWGYPLLILLTIPMGISGGILGLWFMNQLGIHMPLDMITMLGMVVLIGTVVNNPILLIEQVRNGLARGLVVTNAIKTAVDVRLRPIMMSMLTTVFGLMPIVFFNGAGTELYRGLGTIVLFGLLFSTLIMISFYPPLLKILLRDKQAAEQTQQR